MNELFAQMAMTRFSEKFSTQSLMAMHTTNPQAFTQVELEQTIGQKFSEILQDVNLGFAADAGSLALRQSLAKNLYAKSTASDIIAHAGAQEALFCAFHALLKAGDRVLAIAPVFQPLVQVPDNMGCEVNYLHLNAGNNWSLDLQALAEHLQQGYKMLIINFPHNPTGAMLTANELNKIVQMCEQNGVWLLSDEVFRGLEHEAGLRLPAVADVYAKGISIGVISKAFAIPGLRVGWLVCQNQMLRKKVLNIKSYLSICNSQIDELLSAIILDSADKILERNVTIIKHNKNLLEKIKTISDEVVDICVPAAGCCVLARLQGEANAEDVVQRLAEKHGFLCYPASLFNTQVNGLRVGFGSTHFEKFIKSCTHF